PGAETVAGNRPGCRRLRPVEPRRRRVRRPDRPADRLPSAPLRGRRQVLRVDRDRLHRRTPPLGRHRRGTGPPAGKARGSGRRPPPGRGAMITGRGGSVDLVGSETTVPETAVEPLLLSPDGPSVVAIGGGHGLSAALEAVQLYAGKVT